MTDRLVNEPTDSAEARELYRSYVDLTTVRREVEQQIIREEDLIEDLTRRLAGTPPGWPRLEAERLPIAKKRLAELQKRFTDLDTKASEARDAWAAAKGA